MVGWRLKDTHRLPIHSLVHFFGGVSLGVLLGVAASSAFLKAPNVKKPTLRAPTSTEQAAYGDSSFEARLEASKTTTYKFEKHCTFVQGQPFCDLVETAITQMDPTLEKEQVDYKAALQNAKTGNIKYSVPLEMTVKEAETVVVRIYGHDAPEQQQQDFKATGSGSLKVITLMLVTLSQPDNPGSFKIEEDPKEARDQFLPNDSFAEWSWTVTPLKPAEVSKKLKVTAYLIFNEKLPSGLPMQVQISSFTATVTVKVQPRWERLSDWMSENWKDVLKYLIPTGAGSAIIIWLIAKLTGKSTKPAEEKKEPAEDEDADDKDDPV